MVRTLTATNIEWGKLVSRAVLIGGGMVPPKAVSVANGYSATEDLIKKELENNESLFFNKKKGERVWLEKKEFR